MSAYHPSRTFKLALCEKVRRDATTHHHANFAIAATGAIPAARAAAFT
jgi:hypothetical protein